MTPRTTLFMALSSLLAMIFGCTKAPEAPTWPRAQVLAQRLDHPAAITTDEKYIYYVTGGTIASLKEGTSGVWKMPLAGGTPTQLFRGYQKDERTVYLPDTYVLVTDDKYLYWASGTIWRTPKEGGESQQITPGAPTEMVVDGERIYWHNYVGEGMEPTPLYSLDQPNGPAQAVTDPVNILALAVDKEFLYWAQPDGIYRLAKSGGEKKRVYAAPEQERIADMTADQENFYFMQGDGRSALFKISKAGGTPTQLAPLINHAHKFYADETHLYFVLNASQTPYTLNKIAKTGGTVTQLDGGFLASYTVGRDKIYLTDINRILALPK